MINTHVIYDQDGEVVKNEDRPVTMMAQVDPADIPTRRADNIALFREVLEEGWRIRDVRVFFVNTPIKMDSIIVWNNERFLVRASFEWTLRNRQQLAQVIGVREQT